MNGKPHYNLYLLILSLIIISCQDKLDYHIVGTLHGIPDGTVIQLGIQQENIGTRIASDTLMDGEFSFSDSIGTELLRMNLRVGDSKLYSGQCDFWVNNSKISVTGNSKYLSQWKATGNIKEQIEENKLLVQVRPLKIIIDSLRLLKSLNSQNMVARQTLSFMEDSVYEIVRNKELAYFKKNYNSLISVMELSQIALHRDPAQLEIIRELYPKIDTIYSKTLWGEGIKSLINEVNTPGIGDRFIDFTAKDLQGITHKLSEYSGKYILLDFGMMACGGCIISAPETRKLSEKYKDELFVIEVNLDTRRQFWEMATKRDSITWINLSDGKGTFGGAYFLYAIRDLPTYILIDPKGIIVDRWTGSQNDLYFGKLSGILE